MSFLTDLVNYIDANTALTLDTDLFVGHDAFSAPYKALILSEVMGGMDSQSRMLETPVEIIAKELSYEAAKTLSYLAYDLLAEKPGFSGAGLSGVFYCDVLSTPACIDRDDRCFYFSCTLLFRRK